MIVTFIEDLLLLFKHNKQSGNWQDRSAHKATLTLARLASNFDLHSPIRCPIYVYIPNFKRPVFRGGAQYTWEFGPKSKPDIRFRVIIIYQTFIF